MKNFLWDTSTGTVTGESVLFRCGIAGKLLRTPERILKVYSPLTGEEYLAGRDYLWNTGSRELVLLPGSKIPEVEVLSDPSTADGIIYPEKGATLMPRCIDGKVVRLGPPSWYAEHRVEVDYITGETLPELPSPVRMPEKFIAKLRNGEKTVITALGDSITFGWNSTFICDCPPHQKPYLEFAVDDLRRTFNAEIELHNRAVSSTGVKYGMDIYDQWANDHADLMVIAYGMNDFIHYTPAEYGKMVMDIITAKSKLDPQSEFLLVASMPRNPDWEPEKYVPHAEYAAILHGIAAARPDCCVADVNNLWRTVMSEKNYYDMTGNGVNHANDYGHRLYAAVVQNCFMMH